MNDLMNTIFDNTTAGIVPESEHTDHIITEAVILDMLNNDRTSLAKVYAEAGKYAVRDNLLEDAQIMVAPEKALSCDDECLAKTSVLALAKEANDPEYDTYCKALCLLKRTMCNLKDKYANNAANRVETCTKLVKGNPRIMNAIQDACK